MRIITNPVEVVTQGRVFHFQDGPCTGRRVVFETSPPDRFEHEGVTYARTSCGYRVTPFVDPIAVAVARQAEAAPEPDPDDEHQHE